MELSRIHVKQNLRTCHTVNFLNLWVLTFVVNYKSWQNNPGCLLVLNTGSGFRRGAAVGSGALRARGRARAACCGAARGGGTARAWVAARAPGAPGALRAGAGARRPGARWPGAPLASGSGSPGAPPAGASADAALKRCCGAFVAQAACGTGLESGEGKFLCQHLVFYRKIYCFEIECVKTMN